MLFVVHLSNTGWWVLNISALFFRGFLFVKFFFFYGTYFMQAFHNRYLFLFFWRLLSFFASFRNE